MTAESDKYEQFIAKLVKDISATNRDIHFLGTGAKCRLKGFLGQKHQIDVAFIDKSFPSPKLVLIECKLKNPKYRIGPEVIKIHAFNGLDLIKNGIYPDKCLLIVCSTSDFSSGAEKLAEALSIKLERVSFPFDFTFRYENIVLAGISDGVGFSDKATCEVRRVNSAKD